MTNLETFLYERQAIVAALTAAGIETVLLNKDDIPKSLPAAIVTLASETAKNGTSRRFLSQDLDFSVFLVANAHQVPDPDAELYRLKEAFRAAYLASMSRDLPLTEFYTARLDGARLVRVARIALLRSGSGTAS